jgi:heme exporter protein D
MLDRLHSFFAMGGYAAYIWPAYGVFFLVLLAEGLAPRYRRRRVLRELHSRIARRERMSRPSPASI